MGQEFEGTITVGGQKVNVRGDFGSDRVRLSGGKRGDVPYKQVEVVSTSKGVLKLRVDGTPMEFPVGANVDRLANKIRNPASRLDKLGIQPGVTVGVVGPQDKAFLDELRKLNIPFHDGRPRAVVDVLVFAVKEAAQLADLQDLVEHVEPDGALWVVYRKGKPDPSEMDVLDAGRAVGLKDVKAARFSDTHTALKFVKPLAER